MKNEMRFSLLKGWEGRGEVECHRVLKIKNKPEQGRLHLASEKANTGNKRWMKRPRVEVEEEMSSSS